MNDSYWTDIGNNTRGSGLRAFTSKIIHFLTYNSIIVARISEIRSREHLRFVAFSGSKNASNSYDRNTCTVRDTHRRFYVPSKKPGDASLLSVFAVGITLSEILSCLTFTYEM